MKNLKKLNQTFRLLFISVFLIMSVSCEKSSDDVDNDCDGINCEGVKEEPKPNDENTNDKPNDENNTKAAIPTIGIIDGDWDLDLAQRGLIEISGCGGPTFIDCKWVPCDPVATTIVECKYPNGFCQTIVVSGGINTTGNNNNGGKYEISLPGGGTTTTIVKPTLPVKAIQGAIVRISLPNGGGVSDRENLADRLKEDQLQLPKGTTIEDLVTVITTKFSIKEDSPLSPNLVADFQQNNPDLKIDNITILKGEYPIAKNNDFPNGYIDALVTIKEIDKSTPK